jgi:hypothetical protein
MPPDLRNIFASIWAGLASAAAGVEDAPDWRTLTLATRATSGAPRARSLILRAVDAGTCSVTFHTDIRSAKWEEIAAEPRVAILGYDAARREQIRLEGTARRYEPGTEVQTRAWNGLSGWTRTTYVGGPPGHTVPSPVPAPQHTEPPPASETEQGREVFGVIEIDVTELDWYWHPRGGIRRARFRCDRSAGLREAAWIAP